jgi:hypothetical protein
LAPTSELLFIDSDRHGTDILTEGGPNARTLNRAMLAFVEGVAGQDTAC